MSIMNDNRRQATVLKALLATGFLAFVAAVLLAYSRPATGYELSIYRSTPTGFWFGATVAGIIGLTVAFAPQTPRRIRAVALTLTASVGMAVFSLPIIRSYFFYGAGDSMTHLGWARELSAGTGSPFGFIYPVVHMMAVFLTDLSGFGLTRTLQFVPMVVFPLLSIIFTLLCVAYISDKKWAVAVGLVTGVLLIPVNNLSIHIIAHPSSQAVLFLPLVLYLVFRFVTDRSDQFAFATPSGIALAVVCVAIVFIHPQEAMSLILLLTAIAAVQFGYNRFRPTDRIAHHKPIYAHLALLFLVFISWLPQHDKPIDRIRFVILQFQRIGATTGSEAEAQVSTLAILGGSVEELFIKLLLVTLIFCIFAAVYMTANILGRLTDQTPSRIALVTYLTAGLVPLGLAFLVIFFADQGDHYFRFMGFIMIPVTVLAAVAVSDFISRVEMSLSLNTIAMGLVIFFAVMLAMQSLTVHPSPYYYQSNSQVTKSSMDGYAIAFEHRLEDTEFVAPRVGPERYVDAYYGRPTAREQMNFPGYSDGVRGEVFNTNLSTNYESDRYLPIRDANYRREVVLYEGVRYNQSGFNLLETERNIYRVQDNGDFKLYLIRNSE